MTGHPPRGSIVQLVQKPRHELLSTMTRKEHMQATMAQDLAALSREMSGRPVGSIANREAADHVAGRLARCGYDIERQTFSCRDWSCASASLRIDGSEILDFRPNPNTPSCDHLAEALVIEDLESLEGQRLEGRIVVLRAGLAEQQIVPRRYPFYQVEEHQRLLALLEAAGPAAIVGASPRPDCLEPLFEDGDLGVPNATISKEFAAGLRSGVTVELRLDCTSSPAHGENVLGHRVAPSVGRNRISRSSGLGAGRTVLTAHLDTKPGTPGAIDNASGVTVLLTLAELLSSAEHCPELEIAILNGEDHYAAAGQVEYLRLLGERPPPALAVNVDGVGISHAAGTSTSAARYEDPKDTVARFGLTPEQGATLDRLLVESRAMVEMDPWPMGDHMLFVARGIPALAIASERSFELIETVVHTPKDRLELISTARLAETALFLKALVLAIG